MRRKVRGGKEGRSEGKGMKEREEVPKNAGREEKRDCIRPSQHFNPCCAYDMTDIE